MTDKLVNCGKCGGDACYEIKSLRSTVWNCLGCGFTTVNKLKDGSKFQKQYEETLPELFKDLKFVDKNHKVWYPSTINYPSKGIVFADGTSKEDWSWTAMLAVEIKEEEKEKFKKPDSEDYFTYKIDPKSKKSFAQHEFMDACAYIKLLGK